MIFVDSGVWIDFLNGRVTPASDCLAELLAGEGVVLGDLVLIEVLQGIRDEREFQQTRKLLSLAPVIAVSDPSLALVAANNYRFLRRSGITIRKTIDTLIATRCIVDDYTLLYSDRDFDPFVEHLGLQSALLPS